MSASVAVVLGVQSVSATVQFCLVGINQHRAIALIELLHTGCAVVFAVLAVGAMGPAGIGVGIAAAYATTACWLGFLDLARRLGSFQVMPRLLWILGLASAAAAGIAVGAGVIRLMPRSGPVASVLEAGLASCLAAVTVVALGVAFRVQSVADCRNWAARLFRAPMRAMRGVPTAEPAATS
jgi:O-antigen/teichoic acid export membrane protein